MKPDTAPQGETTGLVRVRFQVHFDLGPRGQRRGWETEPLRQDTAPVPPAADASAGPRPKPVPAPAVPKITRLLVLGHFFERLVRDGKVKNYAEIARVTGLSRARVTQIVNLTLLAPDIQENILSMIRSRGGREPTCEGRSRLLGHESAWAEQRRLCKC